MRLLVTTAPILGSKKSVIERFMKAYRETIDFMYGDPKGLQIYADFVPVPLVESTTRAQSFLEISGPAVRAMAAVTCSTRLALVMLPPQGSHRVAPYFGRLLRDR